MRWDYVTPWAEKYHQTTTFVPGVESTTFPGAPLGYLVPGDPLPGGGHIPAGIAPTPLNNFSPRFGMAYSPSSSDGFVSKLTGGPGKTSIRLGGGRFFTSPQGLTVAYPTGNPPYGLTYTSPESPVMETPFIGTLTGTQYLQQFPVKVPSYNVSRTNPDNTVDWSRYYPISGAGNGHFSTKEELALLAFDYAWKDTSDKRRRNVDTVSNAADKLKLHIDNYVNTPSFPGGCPLLNFAVDADDGNLALRTRVKKALKGWEDCLAKIVGDGQSAGEINPEIDPHSVANLVISILEGATAVTRINKRSAALDDAQRHLNLYQCQITRVVQHDKGNCEFRKGETLLER